MEHGVRPRSALLAFAALGLWLACLNRWGTFPDPDAFYHAHLGARILEHGSFQAFPWLDLTTLGRHPIDQHYLYHCILGPAISLFGAFLGTQVMAVALATLSMTALWILLRALAAVRCGAIVASILVGASLLTPDFTSRMLGPKASSIAVTCVVVTLGGMYFRRPLLTALAGLVFSLAHGGWILSVGMAAAMGITDVLVSRLVLRWPWRTAVSGAPIKPFGCLLLGVAVGLLLHPNRDELVPFLWVQIVEVAIRRAPTIPVGVEWRPFRPAAFALLLLPQASALVACVLVHAWARTRRGLRRTALAPGDRPDHPLRAALVLAVPALLTLVLTLRSRRFLEYLIPSLAIWITTLWALLDLDAVAARLRESRRTLAAGRRIALDIGLAAVLATLVAGGTYRVWAYLERFRYPWDVYVSTMAPIRERARPNDRVFNAGWDDFPILFALDDRLRYVWGLDPTFLHDANPLLAQQVAELAFGKRNDAWEIVHRGTQSRFVFVRTTKFAIFDSVLRSDPRFRELARDPWSAAYEVVDPARE